MYAKFSRPLEAMRKVGHKLLQTLLEKAVSRHGKRVFFITSLYFELVQIEKLRSDAVAKLNQIMRIAHDDAALQLPAAMRGMVWGNTPLHEALDADLLGQEISDTRAREISEKVVDMSPQWLRYGRRSDMIDDVLDLIRNGGQLVAAAA